MSQSQIIFQRLTRLYTIVKLLDFKIAAARLSFIENQMLFNFVKAEAIRDEWERLFNMRAFYDLERKNEQINYLLSHRSARRVTNFAPSSSNV